MKKRITTEERNKKIFLAIEKIKKNGETPNCKNVAKETNFSETYIFKIVEKEMQKPIGERTQILLELRKHKKSSERKEEILKVKQEFEKKISYSAFRELKENNRVKFLSYDRLVELFEITKKNLQGIIL